MNKEFVPYEQALTLKELGFEYVSTIFAYDEAGELYTRDGIPHDFNIRGLLSAPTFSQAFRWFREKYELHSTLHLNPRGYFATISKKNNNLTPCVFSSEIYNIPEEAELECLKKLIEIVKNK